MTKSVDVAGMESTGDMVMYPPPIDDIRITKQRKYKSRTSLKLKKSWKPLVVKDVYIESD